MGRIKYELLQKINSKFKAKPLIYFCKEVERAIGLENVLFNYHICCVEDSAMVDYLIQSGKSVFCLEKVIGKTESHSTISMLSVPQVQDWLKQITKGKSFYALTFLPSSPIHFKIEKLGGTLLNNPYELNQIFEDKLRAVDFFESNEISFPKTITENISSVEYSKISGEIGNKFVIQTARAHTGTGTFIIENEDEYKSAKEKTAGNRVKFSEYIEGKTFTLNACVTSTRVYVGSIQKQLSGISALSDSPGSTVGNEFYVQEALETTFKESVYKEVVKLGKAMLQLKYRGLFGIDFKVENSKIYILEINARQTANIPFQTKLELTQTDQTPLSLFHIAEFLDIKVDDDEFEDLVNLKGAQIFLRAKKDNVVVNTELKTGVYRLLSDNSAFDWSKGDPQQKEDVIFIDEEGDKPLIFDKPGYCIEDINEGGLIILFQRKGTIKNRLDEVCRMQFNESISMSENDIKPWITEAMTEIERTITGSSNA